MLYLFFSNLLTGYHSISLVYHLNFSVNLLHYKVLGSGKLIQKSFVLRLVLDRTRDGPICRTRYVQFNVLPSPDPAAYIKEPPHLVRRMVIHKLGGMTGV